MPATSAAADRAAIAIPDGWTTWSSRPETAPAFAAEPAGGRAGAPALRLTAARFADYGAWRREIGGIVPGRVYRLSVLVRGDGLDRPREQAAARLRWVVEDDGWLPDYLLPSGVVDGWTTLELTTIAPPGARAVVVDLALRFAQKGGAARWCDATLTELPAMPKRVARLATVRYKPQSTASPAESIAAFARLLERVKPGEIDLLCLPEGVSVVGTGKKYLDVVEPIPGPSTAALGDIAKRLAANLCAGLYERAGDLTYNTSVLIGRDGGLIGTYRKTHLPQNELDGGMTPGDGFPVYATDIGRVGMMICWDNHFPEPARRLAENGAEIVCLPIWGGSEVLARARAQENAVHLVSASYDMRCTVVDRVGRVVAEADAAKPIAIAEVDLAHRHREYWVGDFATTGPAERRTDLER